VAGVTAVVKIVHPDTGGVGTVAVRAYWIWQAHGWELLNPEDAELLVPPDPSPIIDVITRDELEAALGEAFTGSGRWHASETAPLPDLGEVGDWHLNTATGDVSEKTAEGVWEELATLSGADGTPGKSAYQLAVENGFVGTVGQWLASLVGEPGAPGGKGDPGNPGAPGQSAYQLAVANGFVGTQAEWLASLVGEDGEPGADGKSAYELAVDGGFVGTMEEWLASLHGADASVTADDVAEFISTDGSAPANSVEDRITKRLPFTTPEVFGAVGDGVANDTAAIQAAIDALITAGGGQLILSKRYGHSGDIVHRGGISVVGPGVPRYNADSDPSITDTERGCLVSLDGTARYVYGISGNSSRDDNPGPLRDVIIDGAGVGGATELFLVQSAQGQVQGVHVINPVNDGTRLNGMCQNTAFRDCYFGYAPNGAAVKLLQEAGFQSTGGSTFYGCYFADSDKLLEVDCDGTNVWAHTTTFTDCLFEQRQVNHHSIVHMRAGQIDFRGCIFTRSISSSTAPTSDSLICLDTMDSTVTSAAFHSCDFNGGAGTGTPTQLIKANYTSGLGLILAFSGVCSASNATTVVGVVAGQPAISDRAEWYPSGTPNPTTRYMALGGSIAAARNNRQVPERYTGPLNSVALSTRQTGDAFDRWLVGERGQMGWYDGTTGTMTHSCDVAFGIMGWTGPQSMLDGFGAQPSEVTAANGTVTLDTATGHLHTIEYAADATVSIALNNPAKGRMVIIGLKGNGANTLTWSATVSWGAGASAPAAPADGKWVWVALVYAGAAAGWREMWRTSGSGGVAAEPAITAGTTSQYWRGDKTWQTLDKSAVGLSNVDNTSDANKPVSTAQQTAIDAKQNKWVTGTTATAIGTAAKTATISGYTPAAGDLLALTVTNGNTAASPTLNINGGGAVGIYLAGVAVGAENAFTGANGVWFMRYSGSRWDLIAPVFAYSTATLAEMQAGVANSVRWMTAALVAAAIKAQTAILAATTQAANYTLALADAGTRVEMNAAAGVTVTVPANASVAFPVGSWIEVHQYGAGQVTIAPAAGVTIRTPSSYTTRAQYSTIRLRKRATDEWTLDGDAT
jgi:hypothetical protein